MNAYPVFSGLRLRQARVRAGLSQAQLTELCGGLFTSTALRHWESGRRTPGFNYVAAIAYVLEVPLSAFVTHG